MKTAINHSDNNSLRRKHVFVILRIHDSREIYYYLLSFYRLSPALFAFLFSVFCSLCFVFILFRFSPIFCPYSLSFFFNHLGFVRDKPKHVHVFTFDWPCGTFATVRLEISFSFSILFTIYFSLFFSPFSIPLTSSFSFSFLTASYVPRQLLRNTKRMRLLLVISSTSFRALSITFVIPSQSSFA